MPLHEIADVAEHQLGLATIAQLRRHVAASTIQQASEVGRLQRLERGVYRIPGAPMSTESRLLGKVLAAGDGAVVSHLSAAWLWDLIDEAPTSLHISVPRGRRPRTPGVTVHTSTDLDSVIPGMVRGLPVTDVGRTILDCAGIPGVDVELLIDAARRHHQISPTLLPWVVASHARPGRRGITALRRQVALDELPDSDFERLVVRWLAGLGITGWVLHHRILVPGHGPCEIDIAWPHERVAFELEGADHRDRTAVHANDTARQNAMSLAGWRVLRVTYRRWMRESDRVHAEIADALSRPRPGDRSGDI